MCACVGQGKVSVQSFSDVVVTHSCSQGKEGENGGKKLIRQENQTENKTKINDRDKEKKSTN